MAGRARLHPSARVGLVGLLFLVVCSCACTGDRTPEAPKSAIASALDQFASEYGPVLSHSPATPWRHSRFRVFVRGRFTVTGPPRPQAGNPHAAHYTSGWIGFDAQGTLMEVSLGSG